MNGTRQQIQYSLALEQADQGEAPVSGHQGTEPFVAKPALESSAVTEQLMEEVCNRENLVRAWKELSPNLGDGLRDQAAAVWDCEDAGLAAATSIPSVNLTP